MASTIGDMVARLRADTKHYEKGMADAVKQAKSAGASIAGAFKKTGIGQVITNLGNTIKTGLLTRFPQLAQLGPLMSKVGGMVAAGAGMAVTAVTAVATAIAAAGAAAAAGFGLMYAGALKLAKSAAPIQGVKTAFEGIASSVEGGSQAVLASLQKASAGMIDNANLMMQFNKAAQLVSFDFAKRLPDAMESLQKVAASTGQDLNFLLNSLTTGIGRLSPMILDNLNITMDMAAAYETWATKMGTTVSAMSKQQKQAALMDQVVAKLKQNTAGIPSVFGSAQQVFQSFATEIKNIKDEVGLDLLPTFTKLYNFFKQILPAVRAFGQGFAGTFAGIINVGSKIMKGFMTALGVDFDNIAGNSQKWGENIVMSLARGMTTAIGAVISALTTLGNIIAFWLAPGSPPRLLPNIDKWGTSAANQFLQGMTQANVNILRDLSSQVGSFIQSTMGGQSSQAVARATLAARAAIERALASGGNLLSAVPAQLRSYVSALLAVQNAANAVADAEDRVAKSQAAVAAAQEKLNQITAKYEKALTPISKRLAEIQAERDAFVAGQRRDELKQIIADATAAGNVDAVKFAQLELEELDLQDRQKELEAQQAAEEATGQAAVDKAGKQLTADEQALQSAQAAAQAAQDQLSVQQELLAHQAETNNLIAQMVEQTNALGESTLKSTEGIKGLDETADSLAETLEELTSGGMAGAAGLGASMSELAQSIVDEFSKLNGPAEALGETWGRVFGGIIEKGQAWSTWWDTTIGKLRGWWGDLQGDFSEVFTRLMPKDLLVITELIRQAWGEGGKWQSYKDTLKATLDSLGMGWQQLLSPGGIIQAALAAGSALLGVHWGDSGIWDKFITGITNRVTALADAFSKLWEWLDSHVFKWEIDTSAVPDWLIPGSPLPIHNAMKDFENYMKGADFSPREGFGDMGMGANVLAAVEGGGSTTNNPTYNVGTGSNYSNGIDMATLEVMVRKVVRKEARGGA